MYFIVSETETSSDNGVKNNSPPLKKIVLYNGLNSWAPLKSGRESFLTSKCPVDTCSISTNKADVSDADAVLFKDHFPTQSQPWRRPSYQVSLNLLYRKQNLYIRNFCNRFGFYISSSVHITLNTSNLPTCSTGQQHIDVIVTLWLPTNVGRILMRE
jgi:hypothetical protein